MRIIKQGVQILYIFTLLLEFVLVLPINLSSPEVTLSFHCPYSVFVLFVLFCVSVLVLSCLPPADIVQVVLLRLGKEKMTQPSSG
jgi:hypothetical protein